MLSRLNIYLIKNFLVTFFIVFAIFAALIIIGDFVEQFRKSTGKSVPIKIIFQLALFNFFSLISFIIPIVSFFGALFTFIYLIRNSEFLILSSSGLSLFRVILPAAILYFCLGIFFITIINPLSAVFHERYVELEYKHIAKLDKFASITKNGLWLKQFNKEKNVSSVLYAQQILDNGEILKNFMLLEYDQRGIFQGRIDGAKASLSNNIWEMEDVQISPKYGRANYKEKIQYETNIKPNDITDSLSSPKSISLWRMGKFIYFLEDLGYSARDFKLYYYNLLLMPFLISCLVVLAAAIVSELKHNQKYSRVILISFILIFFIYFLSNLFDALGATGQLNPFFSKIITPVMVFTISMVLFQISFFRKKKFT